MESSTAIAYSSSANLGPGYDVLAVAHGAYHDRVTASFSSQDFHGQVKIIADGLPVDPVKNTAGLSVLELFKEKKITDSITLSIEKGVPTGLGLGSSGASASAAISAVDDLLNLELSDDEKVKYAMLGEMASSGTAHADNVAASIYGGLVLVESISPMKIRRIKFSHDFSFITVIPELFIEGKTKLLRQMVPRQVGIESYVQGVRFVTSLVAGLISGDRDLVKSGMNDDIIEVARKPVYPFYDTVKQSILSRDAVGVCISGAGPSILAVVDNKTDIEGIKSDSKRIFAEYGYNCSIVSSKLAGGVTAQESSTVN
ncbi:MAG: homoserine kinase [Candidatus Thermoplasmatota archaeon]|nr:homoserine kinase [Candidatus Thermoplasmatota archaeon]MDA8143935.1 homoserine kinase [Thermoplasmatales archaeon]